MYNNELHFGLRLNTNGYAVNVSKGKLKTYYLTTFWNIEIGELKHEQETKTSFDYPPRFNGKISRAFVFGKQNNLFVVRPSYGEKRYFSEKAKHKGLAVGISYQAGPTLGLVKPYYLELLPPDGPNPITTKYSDETQSRFLDIFSIFGSSSWTKGLNEMTFAPGLHAKVAVHFDWGAFDEMVKGLEAGIMVDVFFQEIPIMVDLPNVQNHSTFLNVFLNLQLGKRW